MKKRSGPRSGEDIAWLVGDALESAGIAGVLTGGACAGIHSRGRYTSLDIDFILPGATRQDELHEVMSSVGLRRVQDGYVEPTSRIPVEFPTGPLAIGSDLRIRPIVRRRGTQRLRMLSATDSCRDRLAAFYHWNDRQGLSVAVDIGLANRLALTRIREWSVAEGALDRFETFLRELRTARRRR